MAEHVDWITGVSAGLIVILLGLVVRFGFNTLARVDVSIKGVRDLVESLGTMLSARLDRIEGRVHTDMFNFNKRLGRVEGFLQTRGMKPHEDDEEWTNGGGKNG